MIDETEGIRREMVAAINSTVVSDNKEEERTRLEAAYGKENVFDTDQLRESFEVQAFMAPFVIVRRKSDGKQGTLEFQHNPRFYFNFAAD